LIFEWVVLVGAVAWRRRRGGLGVGVGENNNNNNIRRPFFPNSALKKL
jgi:hypothetical protein